MFTAPIGQTCQTYLSDYLATAGGYIRDVQAPDVCHYCRLDNTDDYLVSINGNWSTRWRDYGLPRVYIGFNVLAAVFLYWLLRLPKNKGKRKTA